MFMADVPVDLFRSCKSARWKGNTEAKKNESFINAEGQGSLFPDYVGFTRKDGSIRAPDVTIFTDREGTIWVRGVEDKDDRDRPFVSWKEGVSVSTVPGGFGYSGWFYFLIPGGARPFLARWTSSPHPRVPIRGIIRSAAATLCAAMRTKARSAI
jgi:hypothetical protein